MMWRVFLPLVLLILLLPAQPANAASQLVVIKSNVNSFSPGRLIDSSTELSLVAGETITVVASSGRVIHLSGPYSGQIDAPPSPRISNTIVQTLSVLLKTDSDDRLNLAVTRQGPGKRNSTDPWIVRIAFPGPHCVLHESSVSFWRNKAGRETRIAMRANSGSSGVVIKWPDGIHVVPWPLQIEIVSGRTYRAKIDGWRGEKIFKIFVLPQKLSTNIHRVAWMAERGCRRQARLLLETIATQ